MPYGGAQGRLWTQGISGELPILLLRISESANRNVARQVLMAPDT